MTSDQQTDPWAPGGSMSVAWSDPGSRLTSDDEPPELFEPPEPPPSFRRIGRVGVGAGLALAVAVVAISWRAGSTNPPGTTEPAVVAAAAPDDSRRSGAGESATSIETIVGTITWIRVDGDAATLPSRVTTRDAEGLLGVDGEGGRWHSDDGGTNWTSIDRVVTDRDVGGTTWSSRTVDGATSLWWTDEDAVTREVEFDVVGDADVSGYELNIDRPDERFPTVLGDGVYLPVTVRSTLPWSLIAGGRSERPYRFRIDVEGHKFRAEAGDVDGLAVVDFTIREVDGGRFGLFDDGGDREWTFSAPDGDLAATTSDVVAGVPTEVWTRWSGERFVRVDMPWDVGDRVQFATVNGAMLARVSAPGQRSSIWRTVDGENWDEVELPSETSNGTPLNVYQGDDEVIVAAFTESGAVSWVTEHDAKFQELLPIPGIESRAKAVFGWVAPSPRSAPRLHVSPDGERWEPVDLRELLDLDQSHWSVSIDVTPIDDRIYVVADRPEARTLLIGTVGAAD